MTAETRATVLAAHWHMDLNNCRCQCGASVMTETEHIAHVAAALGACDLAAVEHRVIWEPKPGLEIVCSCGALLSCYGLTRGIGSIFARHVSEALNPSEHPTEVAR